CVLIRAFRNPPKVGIVKDYTQLALVLATKLAHLERTRFCSCLPVHMTCGIFRHIFPNPIQVVSASTYKTGKLAGDKREYFEEVIGRFHFRVDNKFPRKSDAAHLSQERKRKPCCQAEAFL